MEDPKINEIRWACQIAKYQDKNYKDAYLIFQEASKKAMDRRKFNKPIMIQTVYKDHTYHNWKLPVLERWLKKEPHLKKELEIEIIVILANRLHRSSYYRVRRLANETEARLEVPSSCIVDK